MNPTNGIQRKSAYVGWTTASTSDAAAADASSDRDGCRVASSASASAAGTSSCRDPVAGSASAVSAPPCPGAIATTATPAAADAAAGTACRNSAQPASNATSTASGASTVGPWTTTSTGSAPETFATSARKPCQSGNAYPGWRPPSGNSFAASSERSSNARSFWTRARWKNPSPPTWPATRQSRSPRSTPAPSTARATGRAAPRPVRRSAAGSATTPAREQQRERERERRAEGERHRQRREDERQRPRRRGRHAPDAERPRHDHPGSEHDGEPEDEPEEQHRSPLIRCEQRVDAARAEPRAPPRGTCPPRSPRMRSPAHEERRAKHPSCPLGLAGPAVERAGTGGSPNVLTEEPAAVRGAADVDAVARRA